MNNNSLFDCEDSFKNYVQEEDSNLSSFSSHYQEIPIENLMENPPTKLCSQSSSPLPPKIDSKTSDSVKNPLSSPVPAKLSSSSSLQKISQKPSKKPLKAISAQEPFKPKFEEIKEFEEFKEIKEKRKYKKSKKSKKGRKTKRRNEA